MNGPLEVNDHENPEVMRIDATIDSDVDQASVEELRRHADVERKRLKMPLPRISEELKESESSEGSQAGLELHPDAVVQERHNVALEEIKVEDDGIERVFD